MKRTLRQAQAISPFGIGAIVDFRREALMHAGLDYWPDAASLALQEPRLARRLGVVDFRLPPVDEPGVDNQLPFVRFPRFHFCPKCRSLRPAAWNSLVPPTCESDTPKRQGQKPCSTLPPRGRPRMAPLRFVVACAAGHIDDFPWARWAHSKAGADLSSANPCNAPDLKLMETGSAGLAGLKVECRGCGASRTMLGASGPRTLEGLGCSGARPWLGPEASEKCQAADPPVVLQRGASNLYFSSVVSSILIPPYSERARQLVEVPSIWSGLSAGLVNGKIDRVRLEMVATMKGVDVDDLRKAAEAKLAAEGGAEAESEVDYRFAEYSALAGSKGKATTDGDFLAVPADMTRYQEITRSILGRIVLVEKLAETRALVGFSRIEPGSAGYTAMVDWQKLAIHRTAWLPAIRVYGEGIFIELSPEALTRWTGGARWTALARRAQQLAAARGLPARELDGVFVALHTLAHTLIRRLSFECGYGSSSLRERLYYSADPRTRMAGVLIYTAAGDAEGTLGGLVAQGKSGFFDNIFTRAVRDLLWCSADPVCSESGGQGTDSLNLAACHACTLLPETSCEEGNRMLDRASLIGTQGGKEPGLMSSVLKQIESRLL